MLSYRVYRYILIIYVALLGAALPTHAARQNEKRDYFDRWSSVPSKQLTDRAVSLIMADGNIDSAFIFLNVVYNRYVIDPDDRQKQMDAARALNNMGYLMSFEFFDYERAYTYLSKALELSTTNDGELLPYIYVNLGNLKLTQAEYVNPESMAEALPYYKKGFYAAANTRQWDIMLFNFCNMMLMSVGFDACVNYRNLAKEIGYFGRLSIPSTNENLALAQQLVRICQSVGNGKFDEALSLADKTLAARPKSPDSLRYVASVYSLQAFCLMRMGRSEEAITKLKRLLQLVKDNGIKDLETETYRHLVTVYREMGYGQQAKDYEYLYLKSKDNLLFGNKLAGMERIRLMQRLSVANREVAASAQRMRRMRMGVAIILIFAVTVFGFSVALLRRNRRLRESYHKLYQTMQETIAPKPQKPQMDSRLRTDIVSHIEDVLSNADNLCSEDMSLGRMAELTGFSQKLVSQAINEEWQKSFPQLLAEYRIREACRRMQDEEHYGHMTIEGIGQSVGFHTRSNFFATFKRITGLKPTEYIKESQR